VERAIRLLEIVLRSRVGRIQHIQRIVVVGHITNMNQLARGVVQQPVLVVLINPGAVRDFERGGPDAKGEAIAPYLSANISQSARKQVDIGCCVLAARVLVSFVDLVVGIPALLQVLAKPLRCCNSGSLVEAKVIRGPLHHPIGVGVFTRALCSNPAARPYCSNCAW